MWALKVHALTDAPEFYLLVVLDSFYSHLSATVTECIIDLTEPSTSRRPLDCVSVKGSISMFVLIFLHLTLP